MSTHITWCKPKTSASKHRWHPILYSSQLYIVFHNLSDFQKSHHPVSWSFLSTLFLSPWRWIYFLIDLHLFSIFFEFIFLQAFLPSCSDFLVMSCNPLAWWFLPKNALYFKGLLFPQNLITLKEIIGVSFQNVTTSQMFNLYFINFNTNMSITLYPLYPRWWCGETGKISAIFFEEK